MDLTFPHRYCKRLLKDPDELMIVAATMTQLAARKQRYKLKMFQRLYYILLASVVVIAVFFVVSSYSFSDRLAEGKPTWIGETVD